MSANIDGMPCPACKNGHHGQCPIWWWTSDSPSYCSCAECDDSEMYGPETWDPTDAELEDMARRYFEGVDRE